LPHLLAGSLLRLPLVEKKPPDHPLVYTDEVRGALWPSFFESQKRKDMRPVRTRMTNGEEVTLSLDFFDEGVRGSLLPEGLRRYLVDSRARKGDSLLVRVVDGQAGRCEVWVELRKKRDEAAVRKRNQELADAAYQFLRKNRPREVFIWDLAAALLARGLYRSNVAPDTLEIVLKADARFTDAGFNLWVLSEAVTPDMQATIRRRQILEGTVDQPWEDVGAEAGLGPSAAATRRAMERDLADLGALLSEREFGSIEEANAFVQEMLAKGGVPRRSTETALQKAQDLMYDAWDAADSREAVRLARKALQISPDCADAYVLLAEETARSPREALELYEKGVAAGERALGEQAFKEDVGHFWGIIETRPYMWARVGLAQALWEIGKRQDAVNHAWDMLRLNPNDNQGVRYLLLSWLLEIGDDSEVKKLLDSYPDDAAASWLYGRALHAVRTEGDTARAKTLRARAEQENPYVAAYLLGRKRLPRQLPDLIGFGDESEAIACAAEQMAAWRSSPGALAWLEKHTASG